MNKKQDKVNKILNEMMEAKKVNIDDLILKGFAVGPEEIDPLTGKISSKVYNVSDFDKDIHSLYAIYKRVSNFKGSSKDPIKNMAKKITQDITQTVKDIKELTHLIELFRKDLL